MATYILVTFPSCSTNSESILLPLASPSTQRFWSEPLYAPLNMVPMLQLCPLKPSQGSTIRAKLPPFFSLPLHAGLGFVNLVKAGAMFPRTLLFVCLSSLFVSLIIWHKLWKAEVRRKAFLSELLHSRQMPKCSVGTSLVWLTSLTASPAGQQPPQAHQQTHGGSSYPEPATTPKAEVRTKLSFVAPLIQPDPLLELP